jgi:vancomycin permeability regulator SanA
VTFFTKVTGWCLWVRRAGLIVLALILAACLAITFAGLDDDLHVADLAVVLGNKVRPDGSPSEMLKARLNHTADLYRQGYFKLILVSGGHGKEGYDEPVVMRRYLEANGIPADAIFEDNEGYTTWRTAHNTVTFLKEHNLKSVLIISQYFHMPRCRLAFSKFDIKPAYTSHAPFWSIRDFYSVPREVIGYGVYYFRDANQIDSTAISD